MLCREEVAAALTPGTHGSTFGGTPFVTSVALATLTTVLADKLPEHAARMGDVLMDGLRGLQRELKAPADVATDRLEQERMMRDARAVRDEQQSGKSGGAAE